MVSMQGGQFPTSSSSSGHHLGQPNMRPGGPGGSSGHPSGGAPGQPGYHSPGSFPSPARGVKTEVPTVSPRGGGSFDICALHVHPVHHIIYYPFNSSYIHPIHNVHHVDHTHHVHHVHHVDHVDAAQEECRASNTPQYPATPPLLSHQTGQVPFNHWSKY